jgi:membrane protease YdiL (CAAX protease family)
MLMRIWNRWFGEPLRRIEADSLAFRQSDAGKKLDVKTLVVVLTAAACLTIQNYTLAPDRLAPLAGFIAEQREGPDARHQVTTKLYVWNHDPGTRLTWFGICCILTYTVLPAIIITFVFRQSLFEYGLGIRGVIADWPVYLAFACVMVPLVWFFSGQERFQDVYPFYRVHEREQINPVFYRWEVIYAVQFMALEFFFRGFMVHGLKHRFGAYAVFVMVIPYCMIHFHKPWPEACGSILAGVGLGVVSLVTKSIWPGAALHILVAWGMDFSTLHRRGYIEV